MQILVKHDSTHTLIVEESTDVEAVKQALLMKMGISSLPAGVGISLRFQGKVLCETDCLDSCSIKQGAILQCSFVPFTFRRKAYEEFEKLRSKKLEVFVSLKTPTSGRAAEKRISLNAVAVWTVSDLKAAILQYVESDIRESDLILHCTSCKLEDACTLSECNVTDGITIDVSISELRVRVTYKGALRDRCHETDEIVAYPYWSAGRLKKHIFPNAVEEDLLLTCRNVGLADDKRLDSCGICNGANVEVQLATRLDWLNVISAQSSIQAGDVLRVDVGKRIWKSPESWDVIGELADGQHVIAAGSVREVEGWDMVPIKPEGAVQLDSGIKRVPQAVCDDVARVLLSSLPHCNRYTQYKVTRLDESKLEYKILDNYIRLSLAQHRSNLRSTDYCTPPAISIEGIEEITNPRLLEKFTLELQSMVGLNRGGCTWKIPHGRAIVLQPTFGVELNEALLYHGAKDKDLDRICRAGFDPRRGGQSTGSMFGRGTYFAENFSKADLYSGPAPFARYTGTMSVIIARVALGEAYVARKAMPTVALPPNRPRKEDPFDSVHAPSSEEGGCVDHREYVVYKDAQALPVYRVKYRHSRGCTCSRCSRT